MKTGEQTGERKNAHMAETYHIRIAKAELAFSAAHFITFDGQCERLHGHNYHIAAEVQGPLDENSYVVDFLFVRDTLRAITAELDHYVLLPTEHPEMCVEDDGREVTLTYRDSRWVFPRGDCRLMPLANTTAELLARHIGRQLAAALAERSVRVDRLLVEVDERDGQLAVWQS